MHARARTHSCARAHRKRTNLWICVSFIQNHLRWQNAFSLLYENYRFSQWIAFTRKMLKYGWLMMKNVITLYYVYIYFFLSYISYASVIHFKLKFYLVKFIRYKYHRKCTFIHHDNDSRQRQLWTFAQLVRAKIVFLPFKLHCNRWYWVI